jgi:hypothetical protein
MNSPHLVRIALEAPFSQVLELNKKSALDMAAKRATILMKKEHKSNRALYLRQRMS